MPFKQFISIYNSQAVYMVGEVPHYLLRDVSIPGCLQCDVVEKIFDTNVMWMSSGGTKSVIHIDNAENLNCLVRGRKELILVDPSLYGDQVPLDKSEGTFSSIDVDKVDFDTYPTMSNVGQYYLANMTAGDCLYIPYKWIHQVRSYDRNIAVNVWWSHYQSKTFDLSLCEGSHEFDSNRTLDRINWQASQELSVEGVQQELMDSIRGEGRRDFNSLWDSFTVDSYRGVSFLDGRPNDDPVVVGMKLVYGEMFSKLDLDADGIISNEDLGGVTLESWSFVRDAIEDLDGFVGELLQQSGGGGGDDDDDNHDDDNHDDSRKEEL
jgi:hypothetical protein